jgi:hypothetical protein
MPANVKPPLLVTLWSVVGTLPRPSTVYIDISKSGQYPSTTGVTVGQYIVWRNQDPSKPHRATSVIPGLFDTTSIPKNGGSSKPILFDDAMLASAGGYQPGSAPSAPVTIGYTDGTPKDGAPVYTITLKRNQSTGVYSPTLVFREDRVIKPRTAIFSHITCQFCQCRPHDRSLLFSWFAGFNTTVLIPAIHGKVPPHVTWELRTAHEIGSGFFRSLVALCQGATHLASELLSPS